MKIKTTTYKTFEGEDGITLTVYKGEEQVTIEKGVYGYRAVKVNISDLREFLKLYDEENENNTSV